MKSFVNLGCGERYHSDWINIDIVPSGPDVIAHDLSQGIPLPPASSDVVYHAAVLEHMRREDALRFLRECHRVLKAGGFMRVGVPDLERLCQLYLSKLQAACAGDAAAAHDYDWIMLELFDQMVREKSGGSMVDYLCQNRLPNEEFVYERIGEEGQALVRALRNQGERRTQTSEIRSDVLLRLRQQVRFLPGFIKRSLLQLLLGVDGARALEIGRFRRAGEVHHWMYDRYSLARLLVAAGFPNPVVQSATSSQIPNWASFHLDTLPDGRVIKPDLIFMEATKEDEQ
jgi:predicted SAM-dependent methyltransferase